jgi:hypothetical protein
MHLEYLDEEAGLAITVRTHSAQALRPLPLCEAHACAPPGCSPAPDDLHSHPSRLAQVRPDTPLHTVLSRPTLKATFAERRDARPGMRSAGRRSKRGRRKGGYALPAPDEDSDEGEGRGCALM